MRIIALSKRCLTALLVLLISVSLLQADIIVTTFHDANNNGVQDESEQLISGLEVTGYDAFGVEHFFLDNGSGTFILPGVLITSRLRVQVTGYDGNLRQGVAGPTSVFFAVDGDEISVPVSTGPNLSPLESRVLIPCYDGGPAEGDEGPAFVSFPYGVDGVAAKQGGSEVDPAVDAQIQEIGSTWGVAYQTTMQRAFSSTLVKRHVGLGPEGAGGLYMIDYSSGTPVVSGMDLGQYQDLGNVSRENVTGDVDATMPYALTFTDGKATYDIDAFDKVGKTGFGDIDLTEDEKELWMVNLKQRSLMSMDVTGESVSPAGGNLQNYPIENMSGLPNLNFAYSMCLNAGGNLNGTGSEPFTDRNHVSWDKNKYSTGGGYSYSAFNVGNELDAALGTSESLLYQTYRKGTFSYDVPINQGGTYNVILHFAEPISSYTAGDRLFDIFIEGQLVRENFDIVQAAGGARMAVTIAHEAQSVGDEINIEFVSKQGNKITEALVSAVEVLGTTISQSGVLRPWGLTFENGRGYLGVVSDASVSKSRDHLFGYVLSFDPNNMAAGFTEELAFPLGYPRERASNAHLPSPQPLRSAEWQAWVSDWESTFIMTDEEQLSSTGALLCAYPQPIISDIDFTLDGDMVIGLMDRFAHQCGYRNYPPVLEDQTLIISYGAGDILKAFDDQGIMRLELQNSDNGQYFRDDDGPSFDGEFFYDDHFVASAAHHGEIFTGGMGILPGSGEVVNSVFNPIVTTGNSNFDFSGVYTQGIHFYDTEAGNKERAYLFVDQYVQGKANGLGDMEFASALVGGEMGNFVWCDGNGNGIQDPTEFGIDGVMLTLHDKENSDSLVDMQTTANGGEFLFTNLLPNRCYSVRIDLSKLEDMGFSGEVPAPFQGGDTLNDSNGDPDMIPGFSVAMFCSGALGENDHSVDFAFLGPQADTCQLVLCDESAAAMALCADFALSDIMDCADPSGMNVVGIYADFVNDSLMNPITTGPISVCGGDSCVYARVSMQGDTMCYAVSKITLTVISDGGNIVAFTRPICGPEVLDLATVLAEFGSYTAPVFYSDMCGGTPVSDATMYTPPSLPDTVHFEATPSAGSCLGCGMIIFTQAGQSMVDAGDSTTICGLECVDLTAINASFNANGSGATMAGWKTLGGGTFVEDTTFAGARLYCPDSLDMYAGEVRLILCTIDDPCMNTADTVVITIEPARPRIIPGRRDTIDCTHPFAIDQVNNDTFPGCRLVAGCVDTLRGSVVDYSIIPGDCENIVKQIKRTFQFTYAKEDYYCMDTIPVLALPDTVICPPERDSVYCHTGYLKDKNGHPSPLETGFPMADSIPLWPQPNFVCDILVTYKDWKFAGQCPETIRREWFIKNTCTGSFDTCVQWLMIFDTIGPTIEKDLSKATLDGFGNILVPTSSHDCEGHTYIPSITATDTCTDVKMVKAMIPNIATVLLEYNDDAEQWESHKQIKLPKNLERIPLYYEAYDHCHNITRDTCYFRVKDFTKPVTVCDKGVNVTVTDTTVWVHASSFSEGSFDNCGINLLLARRTDWATACGVDLCDDSELVCVSEHHDSVWCARLESDKHVNPIEAHYAKTIDWLCQDGQDCSSLVLAGYAYDLVKYATIDCIDHPYDVTGHDLLKILKDTARCRLTVDGSGSVDYDGALLNALAFLSCYKNDDTPDLDQAYADFMKATEFASDKTIADIGSQIGGGWSEEVPFCCEDACQDVMVEVLAMDYWCNWSKCWTTVRVEDKTPPEVVCELYDVSLTCASYKTYYADAVDQALAGDFDALQSALGTYEKVSIDQYGNTVPPKSEFIYYELTCDSNLVTKDSLIYDEHLGYIWKTYNYYRAEYDTVEHKQYNGQVADNCGLVCIEEKPWVRFDECGNGFVKRVFKFVGQCYTEGSGHFTDTITRHQTIWITSDCDITKAMFEVPKDTVIYDCGIQYAADGSGNAAGVAAPEYTGHAYYTFDNDCRQVGIGYYDQVFKIVGGDEACYKIIRTWCFADWCAIDEEPREAWWFDPKYDGKFLTCTQKIILYDVTPPICTINPLPDTIVATGCYYTLDTDVTVEDECGVLRYVWKVKDLKTEETVGAGYGELNSDTTDSFPVIVPNLPAGLYKLQATVTDECQNESVCELTFEVVGGKKPTPICLTSLTVELTPMDTDGDGQADTAMATVPAVDFDQSSTPACGSSVESLTYLIDDGSGDPALPALTATHLDVGCVDIGDKVVRMYVLDESGSWDYCSVLLIVQNNMGGCGDISGATGTISGTIQTELGDAVELVDVAVERSNGLAMLVSSDLSGSYEFRIPTGMEAFIVPKKNTDYVNGVSTRDLVAIQKQILGKSVLDTWFKQQAADANADGQVNALDLIQLRKLILGKDQTLPDSPSWRFYDNDTKQQSYHITAMQEEMHMDFTGVKIGDVNLDNDPTRRSPRSGESLVLMVDDKEYQRGSREWVAVRAKDFSSIDGLQFTLKTDAARLIVHGVRPAHLALTEENVNIENVSRGWLTASWNAPSGEAISVADGEVLFHLDVEIRSDLTLNEGLTIGDDVTAAEAYHIDGHDLDVALQFARQQDGFMLRQNQPNPFAQETMIGFESPVSAPAVMTIYDVTGRIVKIRQGDVAKGYNTWIVQRAELGLAAGVLYYRLEIEGNTAVKKMILMR